MSDSQAKQAAQQFLRDSAKIMGKYGAEPKLSGDRYKEALEGTKKTFQTLSSSRPKE